MLAAENLMLAAFDEELGTSWIGLARSYLNTAPAQLNASYRYRLCTMVTNCRGRSSSIVDPRTKVRPFTGAQASHTFRQERRNVEDCSARSGGFIAELVVTKTTSSNLLSILFLQVKGALVETATSRT